MKFKFLGTAAAEGVPGPFCACENCRLAREEGGRSIRGRSQALVDDCLLIDFPADTAYRAWLGQLDLLKVKHCLFTHNHQDHLYPEEAAMLQPGFSHPADDVPLTFYGTADTLAPLKKQKGAVESGRIVLREVVPFESFTVMNYTVTAFPANHGAVGSAFYQISDGKTTVLYAHDTGYFCEDVWQWMESNKPQYDMITLDCTGGAFPEGFRDGHMRLGVNREVADRLDELGCLKPTARLFVNHFTHNCVSTHSELCIHADKLGFEVSYDGCELLLNT